MRKAAGGKKKKTFARLLQELHTVAVVARIIGLVFWKDVLHVQTLLPRIIIDL